MTRDIDEITQALDELAGGGTSENETILPSGQRPCPICGKHMQVESFCGVSIDVCAKHGIWLDLGELPAIAARVRSGERVNRMNAVRRAKRDGKLSGAIFGAWSFLLD